MRIFVKVKKITSIVLILLLGINHLGLALGTHYCMGHVHKMEVMIGQQVLDCGMERMDDVTPNQETRLASPPCCENVYSSPQIGQDFSPETSLHLINPDFLMAYVYCFSVPQRSPFMPSETFTGYLSPPRQVDAQSIYQVFRI